VLTAGFTLLLAEAGGYALFFIAHRELPRSFGARTFVVNRLTVTDHPYLPYFHTSGLGRVTLNSFGDRGPDPEVPKRRTRIICFGGSTTFGQEAVWGRTWPGQLQDLLGHDSYEVLSAAHNGDTTAETLIKLSLIYSDLQPDIVLVYHGTNDLEASYQRGFRSDYSHRRRDVTPTPYPIFERLPRWLDYSSYFVMTRYWLIGDRGNMWSMYTVPGDGADLRGGPFGLGTFERNLRSIHAQARLAGAELVLGTFIYYYTWAEERRGELWASAWQRGLTAQNDIIRDLAANHASIHLADLARSFMPAERYMLDFCHFTEDGNREVAKTFAAAIQGLGGGVGLQPAPSGVSVQQK